MAYEVYLDDMLLPVPPDKIPIKYPGHNQTLTLINGDEVNVTRPPGLAEISINVVIPQMDYPCAVWDGSVADGEDFMNRLKDLKVTGRTFEFIVIRNTFDTNLDVTLEDFQVSDDVKEGLDLAVSISMKEARPYGTMIRNYKIVEDGKSLFADSGDSDSQGDGDKQTPQSGTYTVVKGDCLVKIAKKLLGNAGRWRDIYDLNRDKISNPNLIYPGQVLVLP